MKWTRSPRWLVGVAMAWLGAVVFGMACLVDYSRTPGAEGIPSSSWPSRVNIPHRPGVATLVLFLHPECPCSRATVAEFGRVLSRTPRSIQVTACLAQWESDPSASPLWSAVEKIPGVKVVADAGGQIAKRFGAETSGTVVFYDESGKLRYFGGITGERGHEGDNKGEDVLIGLLQGQSSDSTHAHVYGCSIF